jgi:hypothetical protein
MSVNNNDTALGILYTYVNSQPSSGVWDSVAVNIGLAYFSISPALNILLTLMITIRLALHSRNIRNAMGGPHSTGGLYSAVVTMLVESCALYATNSVLYIGPWGAGSHIADIFFPILSETQVRNTSLSDFRYSSQCWGYSCSVMANRSSPHSSLFCEWQIGTH